MSPRQPQLVCPAGSLRALQCAVDAGADAVYLGLKDATNARNFAGLNFDQARLKNTLDAIGPLVPDLPKRPHPPWAAH